MGECRQQDKRCLKRTGIKLTACIRTSLIQRLGQRSFYLSSSLAVDWPGHIFKR